MAICSKPFSLSEYFLIVANVIPIFGILFFDWTVFTILFAYWIENIVIGIYNVFKINKCELKVKLQPGEWYPPLSVAKILLILFFILHFGGFALGHGAFLFAVFNTPDLIILDLINNGALMFAALMVSHGVSYFQNFLGKEEYKILSLAQVYQAPYARVFIMHFVILVGAIISEWSDAPIYTLIFLIVMKIVADLFSHAREHQNLTNV